MLHKRLVSAVFVLFLAVVLGGCHGSPVAPSDPGNNDPPPPGKDPAYVCIVEAQLRLYRFVDGWAKEEPIPPDGLRAGNETIVRLTMWSPDSRFVKIVYTRFNSKGQVMTINTLNSVHLYSGTGTGSGAVYGWTEPGMYKLMVETQDLTASYPRGYDATEILVEIKPAL